MRYADSKVQEYLRPDSICRLTKHKRFCARGRMISLESRKCLTMSGYDIAWYSLTVKLTTSRRYSCSWTRQQCANTKLISPTRSSPR